MNNSQEDHEDESDRLDSMEDYEIVKSQHRGCLELVMHLMKEIRRYIPVGHFACQISQEM